MPYLLQNWAQMMKEPDQTSSETVGTNVRILRTIPHDSLHKGAAQESQEEVIVNDANKNNDVSMNMIVSMIQNLKSQVEEINRSTPAQSTEYESFYRYELLVNTMIFCGTFSSIYLAHHQDYPQTLIGRVYEPTSRIDPQRVFIKILKHIGEIREVWHAIMTNQYILSI